VNTLAEYGVYGQIGGVVMRSPFIAIAAYERKLGLPVNYLNCSMYVKLGVKKGRPYSSLIGFPELDGGLTALGRSLSAGK